MGITETFDILQAYLKSKIKRQLVTANANLLSIESATCNKSTYQRCLFAGVLKVTLKIFRVPSLSNKGKATQEFDCVILTLKV